MEGRLHPFRKNLVLERGFEPLASIHASTDYESVALMH